MDGEDVIQERDGTGNVVSTYLHGPGIDDPITMLRDVDGNGSINHDTEVWHYTKDTLGSVKDLTNPLGQVVQRHRYSVGGIQTLELDESRLDSKAIENPYAFAGMTLDKETGLLCSHGKRCLDPEQIIWLSEDPLPRPMGDDNRYRYVRNRLTVATDPFGLDIIFAVGGASGAVGGFDGQGAAGSFGVGTAYDTESGEFFAFTTSGTGKQASGVFAGAGFDLGYFTGSKADFLGEGTATSGGVGTGFVSSDASLLTSPSGRQGFAASSPFIGVGAGFSIFKQRTQTNEVNLGIIDFVKSLLGRSGSNRGRSCPLKR